MKKFELQISDSFDGETARVVVELSPEAEKVLAKQYLGRTAQGALYEAMDQVCTVLHIREIP